MTMKRNATHAAFLLLFVAMAEDFGYTTEREFIRDCRKAFRFRKSI